MSLSHRGDYDDVARMLRSVEGRLRLSTNETRKITDAFVYILSADYPNFEPLRFIRMVEG